MKYNHLFESESDLYDQILSTSKSFIDNGVVLYRGTKDTKRKTQIHQVRTDRKPVDTDILNHRLVDEYFKHKFGIYARSHSLFTTRSIAQAKKYGERVGIIPIGDTTYVYSTKVDDLYYILVTETLERFGISIDDIKDKNLKLLAEHVMQQGKKFSLSNLGQDILDTFDNLESIPTPILNEYKNMVFKVMDQLDYKATKDPADLYEANKVEIMVVCNKYYQIPMNSSESYKLELNNKFLM